jgi:hypothetical protein
VARGRGRTSMVKCSSTFLAPPKRSGPGVGNETSSLKRPRHSARPAKYFFTVDAQGHVGLSAKVVIVVEDLLTVLSDIGAHRDFSGN